MNKPILLLLWLCLNLQFLHAQIPEWKHHSSPDGGRVTDFALDGETLYALTPKGIYRSDDDGYHWNLLPQSFATTLGKYRFAAQGGVFYALEEGVLLKSDDQGATWKTLLSKSFPNIYEYYHQRFLVKGDTILVCGYFGIYRSTDQGASWSVTADLPVSSFQTIFEFNHEFFAVQDRFVYRSVDRGATWTKVFTNANGYAAVVALDSFVVAIYKNRDRMIRSRDGLRTWEVIDTDTIKSHISNYYGLPWVGTDGQVLYYFESETHWYNCSLPFCYSLDAGKTWRRGFNGNNLYIGYVLEAGIIKDKHLILAAQHLQHSLDSAKTFFVQEAGLHAASISQLIITEKSVLSTTNHDKGHISTNHGLDWTSCQSSHHHPNSPGCKEQIGFLHTQRRIFEHLVQYWGNTLLSYSEDEGRTWNQLNIPYIFQGSVASNDTYYYLERKWGFGGLRSILWKLSDDSDQITEVPLVGAPVLIGEFAKLTRMGKWLDISFGQTHLFFDEEGQFVQQVEFPDCVSTFPSLTYQTVVNETIFDFCGDRAFVRPIDAANWREIYPQDWTAGIPLRHLNPTFFAHHEGIIWVGLEGHGLYYSTDNTGRFYPVVPQMPYPYPTSIAFDETHIWVGTDGGGIWNFPLPKPHFGKKEDLQIKVFPNPSMGQMNLQSDWFILSEINFALFDAAGRQLASKTLPPGQYWSLDFPDFPKGLYIVQLRTDKEVFGLKWMLGN